MKSVHVMFCGWGERWRLGTLAHSGRTLLFEYSAESLTRKLELSPFNLPLRAEAYGEFPTYQHQLPGLIADALPDGWGLLVMDRLFKAHGRTASTVSPLDRLAFIHDRAMGALAFEPADPLGMDAEDVDLLELAKSAQLVLADKATSVLKQLALLGGSPHGARPKVLVQFDRNTRTISSLPGAGGEAWLVKFQAMNEHKEVCAVEELYAHIARDCGLDMPASEFFDLAPNLAAFGIKRFDRDALLRVPTLTLAGLLDDNFRMPAQDYRNLLRATRALTHDEREVQKAFARCVFNVAMNNRDDHTKNFSFAMNERFEWKLAPCYDLTFSYGPSGWHQMTVMGEGRAPTRKHLLDLAKDGGLKPGFAGDTIARVAEAASRFARLARDYPIRRASVKDIGEHILKNLAAFQVS